ncbi:Uncharacterised protein [Bordetella pertussis]|nr:Uncharacterised protein [Bordetella pertussis]
MPRPGWARACRPAAPRCCARPSRPWRPWRCCCSGCRCWEGNWRPCAEAGGNGTNFARPGAGFN